VERAADRAWPGRCGWHRGEDHRFPVLRALAAHGRLADAEVSGHQPAEGETAADADRRKTEIFLNAISGATVARTDPARTRISGGLTIQPQSPGRRSGAGTRATAQWAALPDSACLDFKETGPSCRRERPTSLKSTG
jgi:hypothetical protein